MAGYTAVFARSARQELERLESVVRLEIKRDLFYALTDGFRRLSRANGLSKEAVVADFRATKPARRRDFDRTGVEQMTTPDVLKAFVRPSPDRDSHVPRA